MNEQEASVHTLSPFLMSLSSPLTPGDCPTSHSHTAKENKSITFALLDEICLMHFGHIVLFNTMEGIVGNETVQHSEGLTFWMVYNVLWAELCHPKVHMLKSSEYGLEIIFKEVI